MDISTGELPTLFSSGAQSLESIHSEEIMETIIPSVSGHGVGAAVDEASRLKLQDALRGAADSMETPNDTMLRFFNAVRGLILAAYTTC